MRREWTASMIPSSTRWSSSSGFAMYVVSTTTLRKTERARALSGHRRQQSVQRLVVANASARLRGRLLVGEAPVQPSRGLVGVGAAGRGVERELRRGGRRTGGLLLEEAREARVGADQDVAGELAHLRDGPAEL